MPIFEIGQILLQNNKIKDTMPSIKIY